MSSVVVSTRTIDDVRPHPNADRLELAVVGGWQTVVPKGMYGPGSVVTYVPPDCIVPDVLAEKWGVAKYLSNGRVRATKLRGEPSYGFVVAPEGELGRNVAEALGITKWQPPMKFSVGDWEAENPLFAHYTDVENMRHYPDMFTVGEPVQVTEKIHGTNSRIAIINGEKLAGSRTMQRKNAENSVYWFPWTIPAVAAAMDRLWARASTMVAMYGEVYGKVQSLRYGLPNGIAYAAFDVMIDGRYIDAEDLRLVLGDDVPTVPVLAETMPYSLSAVADLSKGRSTMPSADHIREGVVVRPMRERWNEKTGRVILKYVSDDYLTGDFDAASE